MLQIHVRTADRPRGMPYRTLGLLCRSPKSCHQTVPSAWSPSTPANRLPRWCWLPELSRAYLCWLAEPGSESIGGAINGLYGCGPSSAYGVAAGRRRKIHRVASSLARLAMPDRNWSASRTWHHVPGWLRYGSFACGRCQRLERLRRNAQANRTGFLQQSSGPHARLVHGAPGACSTGQLWQPTRQMGGLISPVNLQAR